MQGLNWIMQMSQNIVMMIVKLMPAASAGIRGQDGSELMVGELGWSIQAQKTSINVARNSAAIVGLRGNFGLRKRADLLEFPNDG